MVAINLNEEEHASKEAFVRAFLEQLSRSRYFEGLKQLNPDDPHIVAASNSRLRRAKQQTVFLNHDCANASGDKPDFGVPPGKGEIQSISAFDKRSGK